ncbi:MAG: hypothetical protein QMD86_00795 [Patescibacteria group bacterium]|nr:hypothetical protein [Patescibacteria group bacterium]
METDLISHKNVFGGNGSNSSALKIISLWFFGILSAGLFSWFLNQSLKSGDWNFALYGALSGIFFLIVFLFQVFFTKENKKAAFVIFLESMAIISFIADILMYFLFFFAFLFLCLYFGYSAGRKIIDNNLKISFWNVSKAVLPKGVLAISLAISITIPSFLNGSKQDFPLPFSIFENIVKSGEIIIQNFFPGVSPSMTFEEAARKAAEAKINELPEARFLSAREKQVIVNQAALGFYKQFSDYFGMSINEKSTISKWIYDIIKEKFLNLSGQSKNFVFLLIGALIFIFIETLSLPIRLVISFFAFILYEIMLALGFVKVQLEDKSKEVLIV